MARREALAAEAQQTRAPAPNGAAMAARSDSAQQAPARSVDDWVRLIRDLRREGKLAEANRELAAFRDAYGERADSLLPADLRDLAPPGAK